jgi:RND family efflux transporter MFP subunit
MRVGLWQAVHAANRVVLRGILPAVILVGTMLWLTGLLRKERLTPAPALAPRPLPPGASVRAVTLTVEESFGEAIGQITPEVSIQVSSRVTAHIVRIPVHAGEAVRRGQMLVELDARDLDARVKQVEQALAEAVAVREYARLDLSRSQDLYAKGVIAQADLDLVQKNWKEAEAAVLRQTEALDEARVGLGYAQVTSPVDGVVIDRLAAVGDLAVPGRSLLVLFDANRVWFQASVQEQDVNRLSLGRTYSVHIDSLGADVSGPLVEIVPAADPASRSVLARVLVGPDIPVYPGMFGRLLLPLGAHEMLLIPRAAVRQVGQLHMVDVWADDHVEPRLVVPGRVRPDEQVEILSGLNAGDRIVVETGSTGAHP